MVSIDTSRFQQRLQKLYDAWREASLRSFGLAGAGAMSSGLSGCSILWPSRASR